MAAKKRCEICSAKGDGICPPCEIRWDRMECFHSDRRGMTVRELMRWTARRAVRFRTAALRAQLGKAKAEADRLRAIADAARRLIDNDGAGADYDAHEAYQARQELRLMFRQMDAGRDGGTT